MAVKLLFNPLVFELFINIRGGERGRFDKLSNLLEIGRIISSDEKLFCFQIFRIVWPKSWRDNRFLFGSLI